MRFTAPSQPGIALMWSFWRFQRRALLALGGLLIISAVIPHLFIVLRTSEAARTFCYLPFGLSVFSLFAIASHTETDRRGRFSGYPARLFTLPVSTFTLITWPMAAVIGTLVVIYGAWAKLVFPQLGIQLPIGWPSLYLAAGMSSFLAVVWGLSEFRIARLVVLGTGGTIFPLAWTVFTEQAADSWLGAYLPSGGLVWWRSVLLLGLCVAAYVVALWAVERQRRGAALTWRIWETVADAAGQALARRRRRFTSPSQALAWSEWRRQGWILPLWVGLLLVVVVTASTTAGPLRSGTAALTSFWLLVTPIALAWTVGKGLGKIDLWSKEADFPTFFGVRPAADAEWIGVKLRVAFLSALVTWLLLACVLPIWLTLWCDGQPLSRVWSLLPQHASLPRAAVWGLVLATAILLTWRLLVGSLYLGLSGKRWLLGFAACGVFLGGFAGLLGISWVFDRPAPFPRGLTIPLWLPWAATGVLTFRTCLATTLTIRAIQSGRVTAQATLTYLGAWLVGTGIVITLSWLLFQDDRSLRYCAAILALFAMPLMRLAIAPFAISANRHRRPRSCGDAPSTSFPQPPERKRGASRLARHWLWAPAMCLVVLSALLANAATHAFPRGVRVSEDMFRLLATGSGRPTVVLWGLGGWGGIQREVERSTRVVSFDRAAVDKSATSSNLRGPIDAARGLRAALALIHIDPPYVLVGHSFNGALARVFAGLYPEETAGLVLVDPFQEEFAAWLELNQPANYEEFVRRGQTESVPDWGKAMVEIHSASLSSNLPIRLLTAAHRTKQKEDSMEGHISADQWAAGSAALVSLQGKWLARASDSKLIEVEGASHNIPEEHPDLVVRAINELIQAQTPPRR